MLLSDNHQLAKTIFENNKGLFTSCYLYGSYGTDNYLELSDIDLIFCFDYSFPDKLIQAKILSIFNKKITPKLSAKFINCQNTKFLPIEYVTRRLLFGHDSLKDIPLETLEDYQIRTAIMLYTSISTFRGLKKELTYPLKYPNHSEKYYGYFSDSPAEQEKLITTKSLHTFCNLNLAIARFILAFKKNLMSGTKINTLKLYQTYVSDEWVDHLSKVYQLCHDQLQYKIPQSLNEQILLKKLCRKTLIYENYAIKILHDILQTKKYNFTEDSFVIY